ncbi:hypothetical protein AGOR_G00102140 [Albula goreensis]|uniref:Uncharacterized protein n=1 Tax=Albula goreensis TaxID=1534307 RepID=A0A8T3DHZ6_9TELE|nr:hypothetical protein AGOR_G00102140 [Albula goreensis]
MTKMTATYFGVILLVAYFSTQVCSEDNATTLAPGNDTTIATSLNVTKMPDNYSTANTTSATGAGSSVRSGLFSVLLPVAMAAALLRSRC